MSGVQNTTTLTSQQTDMLHLIQENPEAGKGHITMLYVLEHPETSQMSREARNAFVGGLYDNMYAQYQQRASQGQIASSGQKPYGSGLLGERRHFPQRGSITATSGRSEISSQAFETRTLERNVRVAIRNAISRVLGSDYTPHGKIVVNIGPGENNSQPQMQITSNTLDLSSIERREINAEIVRNLSRLQLSAQLEGKNLQFTNII